MNLIEARRDNRDAGENHNLQCLDMDRGTFMSHSLIETWAVWSYPSPTPTLPIQHPTEIRSLFQNKHRHYPLPLAHITSFHTSTPHYITPDIKMSYPPHHASSSSLAMTTPSPPTRSGSESRLLDLPNSGTRSTMPKTRSPLSPSPYMDIVRVVFIFSSFLPRPPCL